MFGPQRSVLMREGERERTEGRASREAALLALASLHPGAPEAERRHLSFAKWSELQVEAFEGLFINHLGQNHTKRKVIEVTKTE